MASFHLIGIAATLIAAPLCLSQRNRVFGFSSTEEVLNNQAYAMSQRRKKPSSIGFQVSVIGNFGATFTVNGMGSSNSGRQDEYINITTNEPLTFQAANFTTLMNGGSSASTVGSISYQMQIYSGNSGLIGSALTSAVTGTDAGFNGAQLVLSGTSIPGNGQVVLRLSRTLTLTQLAEGATTYTASGTLVLTIN